LLKGLYGLGDGQVQPPTKPIEADRSVKKDAFKSTEGEKRDVEDKDKNDDEK